MRISFEMRKKVYTSRLIHSLGEIKNAIDRNSTKSWIEKPWIISFLSTTLGVTLGVVATISINDFTSQQTNRSEAVSMAKVFYTEVGYNRGFFQNALPRLREMTESEDFSTEKDVFDIKNPFQKSYEGFLSRVGLLNEKTRSCIFMFYAQLAFISDLNSKIEGSIADRAVTDLESHRQNLINLCNRRLRLIEELLIIADELQALLIYQYEADILEPEHEKIYTEVKLRVSSFLAGKKSGDTFI